MEKNKHVARSALLAVGKAVFFHAGNNINFKYCPNGWDSLSEDNPAWCIHAVYPTSVDPSRIEVAAFYTYNNL